MKTIKKTKKKQQARIVFFDAGGTLFETRGSVGEIYSRAAAVYGIEADARKLQTRFLRAFRSQPPLAFSQATFPDELLQLEKQWWRNLVSEVMAEDCNHPRFAAFFDDLYDFFRTNEAWQLFDDVIPILERLQQQGIALSIISNFDSRLEDVLAALGIERYFSAVHLSSRAGAAKPDAAIFQMALAHHEIRAHEAIHIGDSLREDFHGAQTARLTGIWLDRNQNGELREQKSDGVNRISSLRELIELLERP